ncbi:MAG: GNAT family N-acetyltransferase [Planctomycetes bacterium]|nr:GNAT family N-acetyltransferase [Planctomycetota bacterium]
MTTRQTIKTPRLTLVGASVEMARAAASGDHSTFAQSLDAHVPPDWPPPIMADAQDKLVEMVEGSVSFASALALYVVLREKHLLIGFVGFKGPPVDGRLDIGYALLDAHHGKGYATEAVRTLTQWAFLDKRVQRIVAETLPDLTASIRVIEKCDYTLVTNSTTGHGGEENVVQYEITRMQLEGM